MVRKERRTGNLQVVVLRRDLGPRPGNFKFRRQRPIGPRSLDFASRAQWLAIKVDGKAHDRGDHPARDKHLASLGFRSFRIPAHAILRDPECFGRAIVSACEADQSLRHSPPTSDLSPRPGEVYGQDIQS